MEKELAVNSRIKIPLDELSFTYVRSSGPGGQNVNKVASKAVLHWPIAASESLPDAVRGRFVEKYRRRINVEGELVLSSQRYRDRQRNIYDCLNKLRDMIASVATAPKVRKPTRPSAASKQKRLKQKRETSIKKGRRRARPSLNED